MSSFQNKHVSSCTARSAISSSCNDGIQSSEVSNQGFPQKTFPLSLLALQPTFQYALDVSDYSLCFHFSMHSFNFFGMRAVSVCPWRDRLTFLSICLSRSCESQVSDYCNICKFLSGETLSMLKFLSIFLFQKVQSCSATYIVCLLLSQLVIDFECSTWAAAICHTSSTQEIQFAKRIFRVCC